MRTGDNGIGSDRTEVRAEQENVKSLTSITFASPPPKRRRKKGKLAITEKAPKRALFVGGKGALSSCVCLVLQELKQKEKGSC